MPSSADDAQARDAELDPTMAAERTHLSWSRSALAMAAVAALALRAGATDEIGPAGYAIAGLLIVIAVGEWTYGHATYSESRRRLARNQTLPRPRAMRAKALATAFTGVCAPVLALLT